ncbi:hypothetical protein HLK59_16835 [Streptomyces sp. S3(2020)]|uniref:hypothetical protein n=1 Tax=Streptomyces sp. S3(2020) TaxID=2732044 RepID=UPI0014885510|nr:hypothetical protein [Streptomyces sp. S3(2020)]NNN31999.1 hypothetical protein [Streptomyces sp. S3(2020)]
MPLPHFELSSSQYRLLAETVLSSLPDPATQEDAQLEWTARGLDPEDLELDVPELIFLGLVAQEQGSLAMTRLGAAVHYRAVYEAAEERLAAVVLLAEAAENVDPQFCRTVRRLVQGNVSFAEALAEVARNV